MDRNYLTGQDGNRINAVLTGRWFQLPPPPEVVAGSKIKGWVCRFMTHPPSLCANCMGRGKIADVYDER
jgi:hypothetical protein